MFPLSKNFMYIKEKKYFIFKCLKGLLNNYAKHFQWCICEPGSTLSYIFFKSMNELNRYSYCSSGFINLCCWHCHLQRMASWKHFSEFLSCCFPYITSLDFWRLIFSTHNYNFMRNSLVKVIIHLEEYFRAYLQTRQEVCRFHAWKSINKIHF